MQREGVASRAPKGRKPQGLGEAGGADVVLTRPKVFRRVSVGVRPDIVVIGELVPSPLDAMERTPDEQ